MSAENFQLIDDSKIDDSIIKRGFKKCIMNTVLKLILKIKKKFSLEKILIIYK